MFTTEIPTWKEIEDEIESRAAIARETDPLKYFSERERLHSARQKKACGTAVPTYRAWPWDYETTTALNNVAIYCVNKPNKTCVDCPALKTFLLTPSQSHLALKFTQQRRTHLEAALVHFNRHQAPGFGFILRSRRPDDSSLEIFKFSLPRDFGGEVNGQLRDSNSLASSSNSISNNSHNNSNANHSAKTLSNHTAANGNNNYTSKNPSPQTSKTNSSLSFPNPCDSSRSHLSACQMMRCVLEAHRQQRQARDEREQQRERRKRARAEEELAMESEFTALNQQRKEDRVEECGRRSLKVSREDDSVVLQFEVLSASSELMAIEQPQLKGEAKKSDVIYIVGDDDIGDMEIITNAEPIRLPEKQSIKSTDPSKSLSGKNSSVAVAKPNSEKSLLHNKPVTTNGLIEKKQEWKGSVKDKETRLEKENVERKYDKKSNYKESPAIPIDMDFYMEKENMQQKNEEYPNNSSANNNNRQSLKNSSDGENGISFSHSKNNSGDSVIARKQPIGKVNIDIFGPPLKVTKRDQSTESASNSSNNKRAYLSSSSSQSSQRDSGGSPNPLKNSKDAIGSDDRVAKKPKLIESTWTEKLQTSDWLDDWWDDPNRNKSTSNNSQSDSGGLESQGSGSASKKSLNNKSSLSNNRGKNSNTRKSDDLKPSVNSPKKRSNGKSLKSGSQETKRDFQQTTLFSNNKKLFSISSKENNKAASDSMNGKKSSSDGGGERRNDKTHSNSSSSSKTTTKQKTTITIDLLSDDED